MSEGADVSRRINEFTELTEKLAETIIQDDLLVIMLLSSLSEEFLHFVVAIETIVKTQINFSNKEYFLFD